MEKATHNQVLSNRHIVLDARLAASSTYSGISRFVSEIASALSPSLLEASHFSSVILLFESDPPQWALKFERDSGALVQLRTLGTPFWLRPFSKLRWLWATWACHKTKNSLEGKIAWIAPGNFDGPILGLLGLFSSRLRLKTDLVSVQWIHDLIPLEMPESVNFLYRMQFSLFVRRALRKASLVCAVSVQSREKLALLSDSSNSYTKEKAPICVIPNGIQPLFGSLPRLNPQERRDAKSALLEKWGADLSLRESVWILGVGRSQHYKRWDLAFEVCSKVRSELEREVLFLRVGGDSQRQEVSTLFPSCASLQFSNVDDLELHQLYRASDLNIHPSEAEGFGLPPLESAFCGTPTLYRKGTAVEEHFSNLDQKIFGFASGVNGSDVSHWVLSLRKSLELLNKCSGVPCSLSQFLRELEEATETRVEVQAKLGAHRYTWEEAAKCLLRELTDLWEEKQ